MIDSSSQPATFAEKSRARLDRMLPTRDPETIEITEREYAQRIQLLNRDMVAAWGVDQRVLCLRTVIKAIKLLGETGTPQFYPSLFVMVSDILEKFSELVFDRILAKAEECEGQALPGIARCSCESNLQGHFTSSMIAVEAKETCRNWFYKTACIRELLPRMYIPAQGHLTPTDTLKSASCSAIDFCPTPTTQGLSPGFRT